MIKEKLHLLTEKKEEKRKEKEERMPAESFEKSELSEESEKSTLSEEAEEAKPEEPDPVEAAYCLGAGIDADTLAKAKALLREITNSAAAKTFNPTALQFAIRVLNYEANIEKARREGRDAARAERIADAFREKRSRAEEAASLPHLRGSKDLPKESGDSIFELARGAY